MRGLTVTLAAALLAAAGARTSVAAQCPSGGCSEPQVARAAIPADLRNVRYCEVLTLDRRRLTFDVAVYNTLGLNFCPADKWTALDARSLAKELGVTAVRLNGPRYWTLNTIKAAGETAAGKTVDFAGIPMIQRATIKLKLWQARLGGYRVSRIRRTTVFTYKKGAQVYELVSPKGDIYMMQSYAQIVDPKLSIDDLPNLGRRLKLPKGWKYQTRMLDADYDLKANGTAYVIQDDLDNAYQRRTN